MALPNVQMTKIKERCSGCCRNTDGSCRWGLVILVILLSLVVIAAILAVTLAMARRGSTFFYRNVSSQRSNVFASDDTCEQVAREILALGGNSVDAAVAGAFCLSVVHPQSAGLGGSLIFLHFKDNAFAVEALEQAPSILDPVNQVGVPGFLQGLDTAHREFHGRLSFCSLMLPAIMLASNGFTVSKKLAKDLEDNEKRLSPQLKDYFTNPQSGCLYREGETMKMERYSLLLRYICTLTPSEFYFGMVADQILDDMNEHNLTISKEDLRDYEAQVRPPGKQTILATGDTNLQLVFPDNPGSGGETCALAVAILAHVLRVPDIDPMNEQQMYHATAEALKFAFARRTVLNETQQDREDEQKLLAQAAQRIVKESQRTYNYPIHYGTQSYLPSTMESHSASIAVVGRDGDLTLAVMSLTSAFGSGLLLNKTGIILNDALSRFAVAGARDDARSIAVPASTAATRRRPISALAPILVLGGGSAGHLEALMVFNADNGGNQMISTTAQVMSHTLLRKQNISTAMKLPRIHHQLSPNVLYIDNRPPIPAAVTKQLSSIGYVLQDETFVAEASAFRIVPQGNQNQDNVILLIDAIKEVD